MTADDLHEVRGYSLLHSVLCRISSRALVRHTKELAHEEYFYTVLKEASGQTVSTVGKRERERER